MKRIVSCSAAFLLFASHVTQARERAIHTPRPEYPAEARAQHLAGTGVFALHIRPEGTVEYVESVKSIGCRILDDAATEAFRKWRLPRHETAWTLRVPIRYIDGPVHVDAEMKRPPAPGWGELITVFSRGRS